MTLDTHEAEGGSIGEADLAGTAGILARIRAAFTAPSQLPRLISPDLPWLDVLLISTAVAILAVNFVPAEAFVEPMREAVSRRGEPVEISSSPEVIAAWGRGMGMLATLATHPVVAAVLAGVFTLLFTTFFRGSATFRHYLSLTSHVLLIPALGTVVAILAQSIITGRGWIDALSARLGDGGFFGAVVAGVDPFVVWMLVALAFAVHGLDPARSRLQATLILLTGYLILVGSSAALLHPTLLRGG